MRVVKILLLGANGSLGQAFVRDWKGSHDVTAWARDEMDLCKVDQIANKLASVDFEVLVNAAGMTKLEACEDDVKAAELVNVEAPGLMADFCAKHGRELVHFSTDYVLEGADKSGIAEGQCEEARSVYGRTKLAGEKNVLEHFPAAVVARVSWLFGGGREGFLEKIVRMALAGEALEGVGDKFSKPTSCRDVAGWVEEIMRRKMRGENFGGVWHLTHPGEGESWASYARKILEVMTRVGMLESIPDVRERQLDEMTFFRAVRPRFTVMEPRRMADAGISMRSWEEAAEECLRLYH